MMSVQGEADYLRRSMLAGAREFLVKPFSSDELTASIRQVYARERDKVSRMAAVPTVATGGGSGAAADRATPGEPGQVVAVFSPKGGVGRTTVAVNLAVAAATELGKKVVLVDALVPVRRRRRPAQPEPEEQVDRRPHPASSRRRARRRSTRSSSTTRSGIRVLLAPPSPEMAELITPAGVTQGARGAPPRPRPGGRGLHGILQRHDPGHPRPRRHRS